MDYPKQFSVPQRTTQRIGTLCRRPISEKCLPQMPPTAGIPSSSHLPCLSALPIVLKSPDKQAMIAIKEATIRC